MVSTFLTNKKAVSIQLDPMRETADINENNNSWPKVATPSNFSLFKMKGAVRGQSMGLSPMKNAQSKN